MWVVKLGGSLAGSPELPFWLEVIATAGAGKVVLVPGGGPWAEEVREAQRREDFDDRAAHRMALRAMEQYGEVLIGMQSGLVAAVGIEAIHDVLDEGKVPVWIPYEMVVADSSIPENWDMTSDSLSAWLAGRLKAPGLVLIKSVEIGYVIADAGEMTARGWVDPWFPQFAATAGCTVRLVGKNGREELARILEIGVGHIVARPP